MSGLGCNPPTPPHCQEYSFSRCNECHEKINEALTSCNFMCAGVYLCMCAPGKGWEKIKKCLKGELNQETDKVTFTSSCESDSCYWILGLRVGSCLFTFVLSLKDSPRGKIKWECIKSLLNFPWNWISCFIREQYLHWCQADSWKVNKFPWLPFVKGFWLVCG